MKYTRDGHYQIACKYYFDATHSGVEEPDVNINHPNQYFDESQHFYSGKKEGILCTHVVNLKRVGCSEWKFNQEKSVKVAQYSLK